MEKFLDELILSERKKRKEKVLDEQIDLERDLPEQYLQTVVMSDKATSIKIPAFMNDLPEKLAEQKYEFEPKPQIIKSTQKGNVDFTFSLLDVSVEPGQLGEAVVPGVKVGLLLHQQIAQLAHQRVAVLITQVL